jgi:hypothetical protein
MEYPRTHMYTFCYCCYRYPDKWIDYTPLTIEKDDTFLEIVFKAREFDNTIEIKEMNAPTDKDKWVRNHAAPKCRCCRGDHGNRKYLTSLLFLQSV